MRFRSPPWVQRESSAGHRRKIRCRRGCFIIPFRSLFIQHPLPGCRTQREWTQHLLLKRSHNGMWEKTHKPYKNRINDIWEVCGRCYWTRAGCLLTSHQVPTLVSGYICWPLSWDKCTDNRKPIDAGKQKSSRKEQSLMSYWEFYSLLSSQWEPLKECNQIYTLKIFWIKIWEVFGREIKENWSKRLSQ